MNTTQIKKGLYRVKPTAKLQQVSKEGILYDTDFAEEINSERVSYYIKFLIPFSDLGDAKFYNDMNAQELIRWIIQ